LIYISNEELWQLTALLTLNRKDFTALWRERQPEKHSQFYGVPELISSDPDAHRRIPVVLSVFVFLHYRLICLMEIKRTPSSDAVDTGIVNIALPNIQHDLHLSTWIYRGYKGLTS
jgi:hypothetical protein